MDPYLKKVIDILGLHFPGCIAQISLGDGVAEGSPTLFGGWIVWDGFDGMDQLTRQNKVWDVLDQELNKDERRKLRSLLTVTGAESEDWEVSLASGSEE